MKQIFLFLLLIPSVLLGQSNQAFDTIDKKNTERKGIVIYKLGSNEPFTGVVIGYYDNGNKAEITTLKEGRRNGAWSQWWNNGKKKEEMNYKDGKVEGLWTIWWKNGQKRQESTWSGRKEGSREEWDFQGNKISGQNVEVVDLNDSEYSKSDSVKPLPISGQTIDTIHSKDTERKNGLLLYRRGSDIPFTGVWARYHDNGQLDYYWYFKDGRPGSQDGIRTQWYENGQKKLERIFKEGKLQGIMTYWYDNGQKKQESNWKDNKLQGPMHGWWINGQKKRESHWNIGKEVSRKEWDENGKEISN